MKRTRWIAFGWLVLSLTAHAASFDCAKAGTKVEKLICADAALSKLDEDLNVAYKAAVQDKQQTGAIKQAQKRWMKERNSCADVACVKWLYEIRLQGLSFRTIAHTPTAIEAGSQQSSGNSRFRFCRDTDYNTCEQPGRGFTMCERFLKLLNSLPRNELPPVCDIKLPPGFKEFQLAKWEPIPVPENMRLIYDMEMYLVGWGVLGDYYKTKWPQYFVPKDPQIYMDGKSDTDPETWRRVPYDIWLADYQERMRKGELEPRISRVRTTLNERGPIDLIRYEFVPGGDAAECRDNLAKIGGATGSDGHIFILLGNSKQPIKAIGAHPASVVKSKFLLYRGLGVFISTEDSLDGGFGWSMQFSVARPPSHVIGSDDDYFSDTRCDFRLNK
jgi:uncharacterized protein